VFNIVEMHWKIDFGIISYRYIPFHFKCNSFKRTLLILCILKQIEIKRFDRGY
jgi:hypothetical protein